MINMRTIFREPAARTIKLITEAQAVLQKWETTYMTMRQMIEDSGRDNRWEFDRNKLFARTRCAAAAIAFAPCRSEPSHPQRSVPLTPPTHTSY